MPQGAAGMEMLLSAACHLVSERIHALWGSNAGLVSTGRNTRHSHGGWLLFCVHNGDIVKLHSGRVPYDVSVRPCHCDGSSSAQMPSFHRLGMQMAKPARSRKRSSLGPWTTA